MDNCITKFLDLGNVFVEKVENYSNNIVVYVSTESREVVCPQCGHTTKRVHDYRLQDIKDVPYNGKSIIIRLRKRRYICCNCGKRFNEKYSFLPKYHHMTQRVYMHILSECRELVSYKNIAQRFGVSSYTVMRVMNMYSREIYKSPRVFSIDEFKGNAGDRFQCIIADPVKHKVLEILPNRDSIQLLDYIKGINGRQNTEIFVSDMYKPYLDIGKICFPNAKIVIDKYHYTRQVYWALDRVRKRIQKRFGKEKRIYFKHSKKLIFASYNKLKDESKLALEVILGHSDELYTAWILKEIFRDFAKCKDSREGKVFLKNWIEMAKESKIPEFNECIRAFENWFEYICNSLDTPYTNGFIEGKNNKIKVLKRNAYGVRNFERFRKRILLACG